MSTSLSTFPAAEIAADAQACAAGLQAVAEALRAACADPADAIRLLTALATFVPTSNLGSDAIGQAMQTAQAATAAACRRAALTSLALATADYQPSSYQDAVGIRTAVSDLLDAEAQLAADAGDRNTYHALWALRSAVIADLTARAASLAMVTTYTFRASLPVAVIAQRIYQDPSRSDELVATVNPWHPLFMPPFQALAN